MRFQVRAEWNYRYLYNHIGFCVSHKICYFKSRSELAISGIEWLLRLFGRPGFSFFSISNVSSLSSSILSYLFSTQPSVLLVTVVCCNQSCQLSRYGDKRSRWANTESAFCTEHHVLPCSFQKNLRYLHNLFLRLVWEPEAAPRARSCILLLRSLVNVDSLSLLFRTRSVKLLNVFDFVLKEMVISSV